MTVAVVLAGGAGTRYAGPTPKLLARLADGATVLERAVGAAVAAGVGPVVVVTGAVVDPDLPADVELVANPAWRDGQATSLRTAIAWARDAGADAVVVGLGDQPGLAPEAWRAVAAAEATPLAVATYDGRRGHPVRLGSEVWDELPTSGDVGARHVLAAHPGRVVEVPCPGDPTDIDTVADLTGWDAP
ncbi:NTP transferase domain-containing protein [Iamia sp. SCSIO 61187]|uniref:nucleotidyltransferase family protein n=1 Tax=Iamia sp. SCSIO 61187 TaxID=2722752 RepID=UPI00210238CE|nr:NTP transferase domain-containing protein [Iamia sp. SCSIO 61187]